MPTKITVNGVAYDSVEAMPPEIRRLYEQTLAKLPDLPNLPELPVRDGEGIAEVAHKDGLSVRFSTNVQRRFIVNGQTYTSLESMPPDVRQSYERAMHLAQAAEPNAKKNEIKMWFQVTGPGGIRKTFGSPPALPSDQVVSSPSNPESISQMTPGAIEPSSTENSIRLALIVGGGVIAGAILLLLSRVHQ